MVVAAWALLPVAKRRLGMWWEKAGWIVLMSWVALSSMSLGYSLVVRILPNLNITGGGAMAAVVVAFLATITLAGILARKSTQTVIVATLLLSVALDAHDVVASSFSARDASLRVRAITTSSDWAVGDGAHVLSLNALYRPVQAYPGRGVNPDFVARVKPRYLFRETDHRDKRFNDISWTAYSVKEDDLYAIGASRVEAIGDFPLYPVLQMPGEVTYRLYRVTY